jgi:uncharacterized FlgJ-related protein
MKTVEITKEAVTFILKAENLKILSDKDNIKAVEMLSKMNKFMDKITEEKEKVTRPLLDALNAERARWKPLEEQFKPAIEILRKKIGEYRTLIVRKQEEEQRKIADKVSSGNMTTEKAVAEISNTRIDKKIETALGDVKFRPSKVLKIIDISKIPEEYFMLNDKMLLDDLKAGKTIPGAEIEVIQVPINHR